MAKDKAEREDNTRLTLDQQRARDEAKGELPDGRTMLTNDSGEVKYVTEEEWSNETRQAELLRQGWKVVGEDAEK